MELRSDLDEMDAAIRSDLDSLGTDLDDLGTSIGAQLEDLDSLVDDLKADIQLDLEELKTMLSAQGTSMESGLDSVEAAISGLEDGSLAQMMMMINGLEAMVLNGDGNLTDAEASILAQIGDVKNDITGFRDKTGGSLVALAENLTALDEISSELGSIDAKMEQDLGSIDDKVTAIESTSSDIKEEQQSTRSSVGTITLIDVIILVVLLIVLALLIVNIVRGGSKHGDKERRTKDVDAEEWGVGTRSNRMRRSKG
jgi:hypothetical protein